MNLQNNNSKSIAKIRHELIMVRKALYKDFSKFRQYYFPHYNKFSDAPFHKELSIVLGEMTVKRGVKCAIAAPRGSAKSTIVSLQYVIYCICYKLEDFIVVISNTNDQAMGFLSDIKHELERNERLISDFPHVCEIGKKPLPARWTQKEIITKNDVKVLALGTTQQIRGRKNKEARPSLIILDDIESDESAQNPESYYKLYDWLTKSVLKSGTIMTNVVYIGTIHHYGSLLAQFTNPVLSPGWENRIYKSIVHWPDHAELWEKWSRIYNHQDAFEDCEGPQAARKFYEAQKEEMLRGSIVLWPESRSLYDLMVMREEDGPISFDSEMQNEPINPRDCIFIEKDMHFWDDMYRTVEELLQALEGHVTFYGACDPSLGRQNKRSDFSAIITIARDTKTGTLYVIDADIERRSTDKTIEDILAYHKIRHYEKFGIETVQFQELMAKELRERGDKAGLYIPLEEIKHNSDKLGRIQVLQPLVKSGTIMFSKKHRTLLEQMKCFPKGSHDDGPDALEMAVKLCKEASDRIGLGFLWIDPETGEAKSEFI
mgnify:CR=1 FL=1